MGDVFKFVILSIALLSCSKNSVSDRDLKREQLRASAETKRAELKAIEGEYSGKTVQSNGKTQKVSLRLDIKDIPNAVEGQVDPVMTPILTGYLCFTFGQGCDPNTSPGYAVQKADYDPNRKALDLVVDSSGESIIFSLIKTDSKLEGTWTMPTSVSSGTVSLELTTTQSTGGIGEQLRGEYQGILLREGKMYHLGQLNIQTSFQPPEGLKATATLKLICGEWNSTEYMTYRFDKVQFNPVTGQIIFRQEGTDIVLSGNWSEGEVTGEWSSQYTGNLGSIKFKKSGPVDVTGAGKTFEALMGTYQGKLINTNPSSNLPERIQIAFVTAQDLTTSNGLKVTGNMRLYFGPFGSIEYSELAFSEVQYNYYTRTLVAKTTGENNFTIKAEVDGKVILGTMAADALGEVGKLEVNK